jgi:tRNA(fMet)-specific endonuclease VapC
MLAFPLAAASPKAPPKPRWEAARIFGGVRSKLEASGTPIGPYDTQIAAHALALGATLVTDNVGEFERVAGLRVENWR